MITPIHLAAVTMRRPGRVSIATTSVRLKDIHLNPSKPTYGDTLIDSLEVILGGITLPTQEPINQDVMVWADADGTVRRFYTSEGYTSNELRDSETPTGTQYQSDLRFADLR